MLIELDDPVYSLELVLIIIPFKQDILIHPENKYPPIKKATIFFWGKINNKLENIKETIQQKRGRKIILFDSYPPNF